MMRPTVVSMTAPAGMSDRFFTRRPGGSLTRIIACVSTLPSA